MANPAVRADHVVPLSSRRPTHLAFPAAIAVFAATRAAALQRRAFEAERRAEQLGQYTLRRKLGEGGMGEVWLAEHGLLKRPCAVKFIRPELAADPATAARFAREVQAVTGLTHVNTVRVYDYGRADDGSFYLRHGVPRRADPGGAGRGPPARSRRGGSSTCCGRCAGRWPRRTRPGWSTGT